MSIPSRNLRPDLGVDSKAAPLGRGQTVAPSQMDGRGPAMPRLLRLTDQTQTQGRGERKNVIEGEESKRWPAAPRWTTLGRRGSAAPRRVSGGAVATGCHGTLRSRTRRRRARAAPRLESGRRYGLARAKTGVGCQCPLKRRRNHLMKLRLVTRRIVLETRFCWLHEEN